MRTPPPSQRPPADDADALLQYSALTQHQTAARIQALAVARSGAKSIAGGRKWLAKRVTTMSPATMRAVLTGRTTMTLTQLLDFERALGEVALERADGSSLRSGS